MEGEVASAYEVHRYVGFGLGGVMAFLCVLQFAAERFRTRPGPVPTIHRLLHRATFLMVVIKLVLAVDETSVFGILGSNVTRLLVDAVTVVIFMTAMGVVVLLLEAATARLSDLHRRSGRGQGGPKLIELGSSWPANCMRVCIALLGLGMLVVNVTSWVLDRNWLRSFVFFMLAVILTLGLVAFHLAMIPVRGTINRILDMYKEPAAMHGQRGSMVSSVAVGASKKTTTTSGGGSGGGGGGGGGTSGGASSDGHELSRADSQRSMSENSRPALKRAVSSRRMQRVLSEPQRVQIERSFRRLKLFLLSGTICIPIAVFSQIREGFFWYNRPRDEPVTNEVFFGRGTYVVDHTLLLWIQWVGMMIFLGYTWMPLLFFYRGWGCFAELCNRKLYMGRIREEMDILQQQMHSSRASAQPAPQREEDQDAEDVDAEEDEDREEEEENAGARDDDHVVVEMTANSHV